MSVSHFTIILHNLSNLNYLINEKDKTPQRDTDHSARLQFSSGRLAVSMLCEANEK